LIDFRNLLLKPLPHTAARAGAVLDKRQNVPDLLQRKTKCLRLANEDDAIDESPGVQPVARFGPSWRRDQTLALVK